MIGDRRRKLLNGKETRVRQLLAGAAEKNGAQVFAKVRVADVLSIERSGLDNVHYGYALKAHFDFVVADGNDMPLFAVEFDGPHHDYDGRARTNDERKNAICTHLDFPLARIQSEHLSFRARRIDILTWLTELFFAFESLVDAQRSGIVSQDEILDPMMFVSNPNVSGRFPLFLSAEARNVLEKLHDTGILKQPVPNYFDGYVKGSRAVSLVTMETTAGTQLLAEAAIYLDGFGVLASEAVEEIAVVELAEAAKRYQDTQSGAVSAMRVRQKLAELLRATGGTCSWGGMGGLGFPCSFQSKAGKAQWILGPFAGSDSIVIESRH